MPTIAIVYHTTYGHTRLLAEAVQRGAQSFPGAAVTLYTTEEATAALDKLDSADAIIFGCPTYMGSLSAGMKAFIEAAAAKWFTSAWKDKIAGAFTNSSSFSGDKLSTLLSLVINAMQHGMIYVGLAMFPSANRPGDMNSLAGPSPEAQNRLGSWVGPMSASFQVNPPGAPCKGDLETGEFYGLRVATITAQFLKGRGA
jgi:NAD(P)H dehydrogenase (quinone)